MGPTQLPTRTPAPDVCCGGLTVKVVHQPRPATDDDLNHDLEQAAPARGGTLVDLADTLHRAHGGSRRRMLAVVLEAATLGLK